MAERPLRVLSVAHTAVSREAGRLRYHPLAARPDLDVHLVTPRRWYQFGRWHDADPGPEPGVTLHIEPICLPRFGWARWYLHYYPGLLRLIDRFRPDVLHLWEEPWSFVAWQAVRLQKLFPELKIVLEVDQNIHKRLPPPFGWIRRYVLSHTALVLSRSDEATSVVRACGFRNSVHSIGYGVDQTNFYPVPAPILTGPQPLRLGYVGRIVVEKGLDDALDALALVPGVVLAIMGEGPHLPALTARIRQLGLEGRVMVRGWGKPAEVSSFIQGLDALILLTRTTASVREQFGRVITEAQACGVPVIGSASGAIPDVIGAGGWVVPERDPPALARLLAELAAHPLERKLRGNAGIENVDRRFTYGTVARHLADAWHAATRSPAPASARPFMPVSEARSAARGVG